MSNTSPLLRALADLGTPGLTVCFVLLVLLTLRVLAWVSNPQERQQEDGE